ncbi:MAG: class I SAM-dependent RNA methyltransferase [Flavobacteriaceae bacterium]|jgi:putative N6-adenine-specific DNA methylase|nr:class I SAM-dependent RNA methyltransferase [Flavobacteriaceae bacterium]NVJ73015.1 class I SAM-dependent RNA methyltransferase [Flavobacteriaceae bacterium]
MIAKTLYGFEELLEKELRSLGASKTEIGVRNVSFEGDNGFMYKANLNLRTAIKIIKPIYEFRVRNEEDLYKQVYSLALEHYLSEDQSFAIDTTLATDLFSHSLYVSQKAKDAIVDKFRKKTGRRPSIDIKNPDVKFNLHIQRNHCTLSLDSSGSSLHHRGYRTATNIAPINEVLAAGILLLSGWDGRGHFLDPMCGSGTFLIEAAMIACNIPANINRKGFAFEKWKDFDSELYQKIVETSLNKVKDFHYTIKGYDKAPSAVRKAIDNAENANLSEYITVEQTSFFESKKDTEGPLHMVFNPPYGERLSIDMEEFYASIGDTLKQSYPGTKAWMISSNLDALKHVGLKTSRKIKLFNSQLESRLVCYDMYQGSKKRRD